MLDILLPSGMVAKKVLVIEGDPIGCDVLIGMDIISEGDFIYSYNNDFTQFGFRAPSELTKEKMEKLLQIGKYSFTATRRSSTASHPRYVTPNPP